MHPIYVLIHRHRDAMVYAAAMVGFFLAMVVW